MKITKTIIISDKVVSLDDVLRIANIFQRQKDLAHKAKHYASIEYRIDFTDNTSIEVDDVDMLTEDVVNRSARPIRLHFFFYNHSLSRKVEFTLRHGELSYENTALVSGAELSWLSETFDALQEAIARFRPQSFWFRRHRSLLLHLIAIGIGSLGMFILGVLVDTVIGHTRMLEFVKPLPADSLRRTLVPAFYVFLWMVRWGTGLTWGAYAVRTWLLDLWPTIEFAFGLEHLNIERAQRQRLMAVFSLIVLPILTSVAYDCLKIRF